MILWVEENARITLLWVVLHRFRLGFALVFYVLILPCERFLYRLPEAIHYVNIYRLLVGTIGSVVQPENLVFQRIKVVWL